MKQIRAWQAKPGVKYAFETLLDKLGRDETGLDKTKEDITRIFETVDSAPSNIMLRRLNRSMMRRITYSLETSGEQSIDALQSLYCYGKN
jgi:hypothetical protein